jgi:hypothetical protein
MKAAVYSRHAVRGTSSHAAIIGEVPSIVVLVPLLAQLPRVPDLEAQRKAMKKLGFLFGKWAG